MDIDIKALKRDYESLIRDYGPMIYTLSVRLCKRPADGLDLAEKTFVQAYQSLLLLQKEPSIPAWLYRICLTVWKNRLKTVEKPRHFWSQIPFFRKRKEEADDTPRSSGAHMLFSTIKDLDRLSAVPQALPQLTDEDRVVLVLRDMADESYAEISELLGISLGSVKARVAQSRERLRDILETQGK